MLQSTINEEKVRQEEGEECKVRHDVGKVVLMEKTPEYIRDAKKLQPKYRGPLVVLKVLLGDTKWTC